MASSRMASTLPNELLWQYVIYQQGGTFHHAPCPTAWTKASALAAKGDQTILVARGTLHPDEPVFHAAAFQEVLCQPRLRDYHRPVGRQHRRRHQLPRRWPGCGAGRRHESQLGNDHRTVAKSGTGAGAGTRSPGQARAPARHRPEIPVRNRTLPLIPGADFPICPLLSVIAYRLRQRGHQGSSWKSPEFLFLTWMATVVAAEDHIGFTRISSVWISFVGSNDQVGDSIGIDIPCAAYGEAAKVCFAVTS